ncbi:MAG: MATE family efflux transporter [Lactococcus raffinolactis]|jgi:putative MATE family efflux protein|uniref:Probable multidrug resistance protein NorM n=1 Tax=Pseudolactococcus raffinolactis TaxID=1366 RepID=A0A6H0UDL4_9LACT|nr:MATE family efflux transporter [Lactococcus raffinolactis]MBW9298126.1 MATE family efflux transporter [Lactococcus raffinolactis]MBW9330647.1 MATE family efflux transporter [Lactococcus raffinolactis]MCH4161729.1 MATE family efflux transporter [Lactococcus raffinolactis]MDN5472656.1 MATE family efflux transporter [Lactococcus raffinolactis]MDN5579839.1 MATE family efflux transporter [Lactococcus raffinolactis]
MKENTRRLIDYSLPAVFENILQTSVGFVDSVLIAKISLVAVSAVSLVNGVMAVYQAVFIALAVAVATVVSNAAGARASKAVSENVRQSIALSLMVGVILSLLSLVLAHPILRAMGASGDILQQGIIFFRVIAGTSVLIVLMTVLGQLIRTAGQTRTPLTINLIVNILNFCLDFILIFGLFGFPRLGILGAGIGTALSRLIGVGLLFHKLQQTSHRLQGPIFSRDQHIFKTEIVKRALPIMGERLMMRLGDIVIFVIIIAYGSKVFAGNAIGETITAYNYLPAFGFATGASILIARAYGAKDHLEIRKLTKTSFVMTAIISTLVGGIIFAFSTFILNFFTFDAVAVSAAQVVILISFVSEPIVAGVIIYTAALQAMGDAKTPFYATMFGMWVIRIGIAWLLGTAFGWGIWGVWIATVLDNIFRLIVLKLVYECRIKNQNIN